MSDLRGVVLAFIGTLGTAELLLLLVGLVGAGIVVCIWAAGRTAARQSLHQSSTQRGCGVIRFACPRCQAAFDVPDDRAGQKNNCPWCQQRLQVPALPTANKTVLAPLLEHQPDPAPRPPPRPPPDTLPVAVPSPPVAVVVPPTAVLVPPGTPLLARQDVAYLPGGKSNRVVVGVVACAFGFLGLHHFMLDRLLVGILCVLGALTIGPMTGGLAVLILWAVSVAEGVRLLTMTDQQFLEYAGRRKGKAQ